MKIKAQDIIRLNGEKYNLTTREINDAYVVTISCCKVIGGTVLNIGEELYSKVYYDEGIALYNHELVKHDIGFYMKAYLNDQCPIDKLEFYLTLFVKDCLAEGENPTITKRMERCKDIIEKIREYIDKQ